MTERTPINEAMLFLASQHKSLFIGQGVEFDGISMYHDLEGVPMEQKLEFPVAEELQLGYGIGLSLMGYLPVLIYPRMDFLLRAADALVNHLDKLALMSCGQFKPGVIIRTRVGTRTPLDAGPQHTGRHTEAFRLLMPNVKIYEVIAESQIGPSYRMALENVLNGLPTMVIEAIGD